MNPQSAAIVGSGNPLKSRFESEIQAKIFQNPPICSPIHPPQQAASSCRLHQGRAARFIAQFNNDAIHGHSSNYDRIKKNESMLNTFHLEHTGKSRLTLKKR